MEVYKIAESQVQSKEGCRVKGAVEVNRIPGNIHFSFHKHENVIFKLREQGLKSTDLTHIINSFQFDGGATKMLLLMKKKYRDLSPTSPLDSTSMSASDEDNTFVYFLNVIRTVYNQEGKTNHTLNQYTVNKYTSKTASNVVPAVYMRYDIAPIYVYYTFRENSVMHFLVRIIAIIGGVITVAGIVVSFLQSSVYQLVRQTQD